jgi:hypothetical protein
MRSLVVILDRLGHRTALAPRRDSGARWGQPKQPTPIKQRRQGGPAMHLLPVVDLSGNLIGMPVDTTPAHTHYSMQSPARSDHMLTIAARCLPLITLLASLLLTTPGLAQSYFGAAECSNRGGWNYVPYREDSRRFPLDAASVATPPPEGPHYVSNIDYTWDMWFSANVQAVAFVFSRLNLEAGYDFLTITGSNTLTLTGNLDDNGSQLYTTDALYPTSTSCETTLPLGGPSSDADNYVTFHFTTDASVNKTGWAIAGVWVRCDLAAPKPNASRACRSDPNVQHDGVLIGQGDAANGMVRPRLG